MRILHVIRSADPATGGPIEGLLQRGQLLVDQGHTVEILSADGPDEAFVQSLPVPIHAVGPGDGLYGSCPALMDWLKQSHSNYDLVSAHGIWQYPVVATHQALAGTNTPYIVFVHGMLDPWFDNDRLKRLKKDVYWKLKLGKALAGAQRVLFTTEEERRLAHNRFKPYDIRERVVAYGTRGQVGDAADQLTKFRAKFPQIEGKQCLTYLSRIHQKKGCDLLVEAFAKTYKGENVMLILAGPDQVGWVEKLQAQATALGVADQIIWPGMLKGDDKWGAYLAGDAFVLPSHQENFGIVVAEALSCARPVLISNRVNIWREVEADSAGFVEPDDQAGTDKLLARWKATTPADREAMGANARRCFESHFSVEGSAADFLKVAEEIGVQTH